MLKPNPEDKNKLIKKLNEQLDLSYDELVMAWKSIRFYRKLLIKTGKLLGKESYICDDGSISSDPLVLKVPELVKKLVKENKDLKKELKKCRKQV